MNKRLLRLCVWLNKDFPFRKNLKHLRFKLAVWWDSNLLLLDDLLKGRWRAYQRRVHS